MAATVTQQVQPAETTYQLRYEIPHFIFDMPHEPDRISWHAEMLEFTATSDEEAGKRVKVFLRALTAPASKGSLEPRVISFLKLTQVG